VQERAVIVSYPSVPVEIVRAAGFRPEVARGSAAATPAADAHLEPGIFPSRVRHLLEAALTGHLAHAGCIVIPRTSDADYKCFLYLRELVRRGIAPALPPIVLFDLLQSQSVVVRSYDVARTAALCDALAVLSDRTWSADDLRREIRRSNAARAAARRLLAVRRPVPRITGSEVFPLLAAFWKMDPDSYVVMATDAAREIAARVPLAGPRVLLSGAPVDTPVLHEAIESHGAIVTAEIGPWGAGVAGDDVRLNGDPVAALADKYRVDALGTRTPVASLVHWTKQMLDQVDAVVVSLPPDDAVFGWDYPALRDRLQANGIPHVCLRGDPHQPLTPSDHARLGEMVAAARLQEARHG
jgi:benzoyl-CoA reductase subunit C